MSKKVQWEIYWKTRWQEILLKVPSLWKTIFKAGIPMKNFWMVYQHMLCFKWYPEAFPHPPYTYTPLNIPLIPENIRQSFRMAVSWSYAWPHVNFCERKKASTFFVLFHLHLFFFHIFFLCVFFFRIFPAKLNVQLSSTYCQFIVQSSFSYCLVIIQLEVFLTLFELLRVNKNNF